MNGDDLIQTRQSLLSRLRDAQDQSGWQEFFDTYGKLIYGVARKAGLTHVEAQDVVQETVIEVAGKMPSFRYDPRVDSFSGWLLTITRWRIVDQLRKRPPFQQESGLPGPTLAPGSPGSRREDPRRTTTEERLADPAGSDLERIWEAEWSRHLIYVALEKLKRRVRSEHYEIFYLAVIKELPVRQVAATLGVSVALVYVIKHRLSRLLRNEIRRLGQSCSG